MATEANKRLHSRGAGSERTWSLARMARSRGVAGYIPDKKKARRRQGGRKHGV